MKKRQQDSLQLPGMTMCKPGARVIFNKRCAWPERVGCKGVVVDPAIFNGKYPADPRSDQVLVLLDRDPLASEDVFRDSRWTCRTPMSALDALVEAE